MDERRNRPVPPTAAASAHLGDTELTEIELSQTAETHLANCAWCQRRRQAMSPGDRDELSAMLEELDAQSVSSAAQEAAAAWSLPSELADLLQTEETEWPDVAPAQLWRLSWRGEDALAVVLERDSWWVRVAPLTTDVALADEYTFVADENSTSLHHPAGIFLRATATIPMYTFARFLGDVGMAGSDDVGAGLRRLEASCLRQSAPPEGLPTGSRLEPDDWDRLEALDALHERMRWFESATHGVVDRSGLVVGREGEEEASPDAVGASELLKKPRGTLREVVAATHLDPARLQELKTGRVKPSRDERAALERYFGVPVKAGHPSKKRIALLEVVSRPSHRDDWLEWQQEMDATDVEVEDALVPFMEHMLEASVAARSVVIRSVQPEEEWSLEEWRQWWEERLAMRRKERR